MIDSHKQQTIPMLRLRAILCRWLLFCILLFSKFSSQAQLVANFSAFPTAGCAPFLVTFSDASTGNPTNWRWDLGNGTTSFLQNPSVTYFSPGLYSVKLVISNSSGSDSIIKNQYINVHFSPGNDFSGSPTTGCYPLPVHFTDLSSAGSGTINSWEWDFGDGNISSTQSPSHTYTGSGNFNVSLRVTNSFGCVTTITKPSYIHISSGVHAAFTNSTANSCNPPLIVNFQNQSLGTGPLTYQWNFGDGGSSTAQNPSYTYLASGSYTVRLIVINSVGCVDTVIHSNVITVGIVHADFTMPPTICQGQNFDLTNTSVPLPSSVLWDFTDGTTLSTLNATKIYNSPGLHTVKMKANFNGCLDSSIKTINTLVNPVIAFTGDALTSCRPPLIVNFTGLVPGATSFSWDFGDNSTSTTANPTHTYTTYGSFTVKLKATNQLGCSDSLIKTNYIVIQSPHVSIAGLPAQGCAPFPFQFVANVNTVDTVVGYQWDFGDGATSILPSPSHIFAAGVYTIKLIITTSNGCSDSVIAPAGVSANYKPTANFSANPRDVCAFIPIIFTDLSTGLPDKWLWRFGDGGISVLQNPSHAYQDTGWFNVQLIVWRQGCADSIKFINYIHIKPPIAIFEVLLNCSSPKTRSFLDHSIGADTWAWDFGDGSSSTIPSPTHTYGAPGSYHVQLTVTNIATGCQHIATDTVKVITEKANFIASDTVICKRSQVGFHTINVNPLRITNYHWDFGDGSTLNILIDTIVTHTYINSGSYNVTLVIKDLNGCSDTLLKPLYIYVHAPIAAFVSPITTGCVNSPIHFIDSSLTDGLHPIQSWMWNFGDSVIQTVSSPPFQHPYSNPGTYTVSLKITDNNGCTDSVTRLNYILISKPIANFTSDTLSCTSGIINFTNLSTGPNLTYNWAFGDGSNSNLVNPIHQYLSQGVYSVSLAVIDQNGCTSNLVKPNYIQIADAHADFTLSDSLTTCPPLIINFVNTSTNYISKSWDFGDGTTSSLDNPTHFYTISGSFNVVLSIIGPGGCTDTKSRIIVVRGPEGSFSYTNIIGCKPLTTNFVATSRDHISFIWDYNDGVTVATPDSIRTHTYQIAGSYVPKLILVDTNGCHVPIIGRDTIHVYEVAASLTHSTTTLCDSGAVTFHAIGITNDIIASYAWTFSDGTTSTLQNPVHQFNVTGQYNVKLVITTQAGCHDSSLLLTPIKIVASPQVGILGGNGSCIPAMFNFNGQIIVPDTSAFTWNWNFGNGNISTLQNPPTQVYVTAGSYIVSAVAINSSGCKDSITKLVQAFPIPNIRANGDSWLCKGQGLNLIASGANTYNWSPGTGLSCVNCPNPLAAPVTTTRYIVTGTSSQGCIGKDTVLLSVKQPFVMIVARGDTLCRGSSVRLRVAGGSSYVWSPSTGLDDPLIARPIANPIITTTYMVVGTDDRGCFKDTGYAEVKVWPVPTVNAGMDKTINVGQTVDLIPVISNDVTNVSWTPTTGIFRNFYPGVTVRPNQTTEYTVNVSNAGGCKSRDKVTIFVVCNNGNVFIPNTFSPNGDGMNDQFYIRGNGLFTIKTFRIFNRWGQVVFEKSNVKANEPMDGWDGTFNGQKLSPDVFVYTVDVICDNNTTLKFQGNVTLIK